MYALRDVPGKGKGLIATQKILRGTRILSEKPIVTIVQDEWDIRRLRKRICKQIDSLSKRQKQAFLSMYNIYPYNNVGDQYIGIIRTNGLPMDGNESGIFLNACRINHACYNNAQKNWNERIQRHTIHALRDIDEGEEITICYLAISRGHAARHKALLEKFGFTCSCRLCSLPLEDIQEYDNRLEKIFRLDILIGQCGLGGIVTSPLQTLRYVDEQTRLYNEQGPYDAGLPRAFLDAAQISIANGDLARGRIFMEKAVFGWRMALGSDSPEVANYGALVQDVSNHELYGTTMKWKTAADDVPRDLQPEEFEDWLWKREKPLRTERLANLRNRIIFPGFVDLPCEEIVDLNFYQSIDMVSGHPRRHWCFLAEIVDCSTFLRLHMLVKDINGRTIPLFFYTDERENELSLANIQRGFTVAILYAQRHHFVFGDSGIRLEGTQMIKIYPASLQTLLTVNDQVQQFSVESNGRRICHGCGKKGVSLKRCSKCLFFCYCDKACQMAGWDEKNHKTACKLLKDPDLRRLFSQKWEKFDDYLQFPLGETQEVIVSSTTEVKDPGTPYAVKVITGKGKGLVATTKIAQGTRLLSEAPLFIIPQDNANIQALECIVESELEHLDDNQRRFFFELTNIYGDSHSLSLGITKTNLLPLGSNAKLGGLFLEASRINHSCKHNSQNTWNEHIGRLTIHALRDIEAGEEITISYLNNTPEYAERQRSLKEMFKFQCKCELCSLPRGQRKDSDRRLRKLENIDSAIGGIFWGNVEPELALQLLHEMVELFKNEGIWDARIARAYNDAYEIASRNKDYPRARIFAERAYKTRRLIEGDDSPVTVKMKKIAENISAKTPQGLAEDEFEDWLWMVNGTSSDSEDDESYDCL